MSLPDIDYVLDSMGQFEYGVDLASPRTPEDMKFVADAFAAGQQKERARIEKALIVESSGGHLDIAVFKLQRIINAE
jgi:tRNA A37 threonylcarbamoyladenosine dehydratase